ncbi:hypothetical protein PN290_08170 [Romboutsia sp. 1001216sp1]|uniref:hypothetical protein n=1 Tax=Romboutsia TaxID=1501226 RepID=UPI000B891DC2|nr:MULTISPECIES: hypothetical protein [Romboutsia]MDB8793066.1 hypothetical protein [Romboutsia sp. 1001216sp1]MDB8795859.1 hypothetical protein [Romboutsia sp. 1001216sp1]MDB8799354.1 hypothetical protein [Romboutsia sp. 1001216sp1]
MEDNNSFMDGLRNLGKQLLYTESENTNTDRENITEINSNGNKRCITRAGAGPKSHNRVDNPNNKFR